MRIGIVSKWFDRGQPVVGRYLRSALEELGHDTVVLARPKKERGPRPGALDREGIWDQPGITEASAYDIPRLEYESWIEDSGVEVVLCDQNYQFEEIAALRRAGIRTVGRFVWEHFSEEHVAGALEAYEVIYSFTRAEQERYRRFGIESPYVTWGCHPELLEIAERARADRATGDEDTVRMIFPGGFIGHRKPLRPVVEAFLRTTNPDLRLIVKAQVERRRLAKMEKLAAEDERVEIMLSDQPRLEHLRLFAGCDVCVSPARWEGLGLPLYEATAFGMPIVTNDNPPMNEIVRDGLNGILVRGIPDGEARSAIPAFKPDVNALAEAFERLADRELRESLAEGSRRILREERGWERTVAGIGELLASLVPAGA